MSKLLHQKIVKEISKKYNMPEVIVRDICNHTFRFIRDVANDLEDYKGILLSKLFTVKLKPMFKDDKKKGYNKARKDAIEETMNKRADRWANSKNNKDNKNEKDISE